jgi:hypothetical protein
VPRLVKALKQRAAKIPANGKIGLAEAAERADLQRRFNDFLRQTEPFVAKSPHPKAALYRHAWKRAAVLGIIYQQARAARMVNASAKVSSMNVPSSCTGDSATRQRNEGGE